MVEFSRIGSTTPARPRRIDEKAQTPRMVPDDASQILAVFAVFAANYQPAKSRFPQESWAAGGVDERKNSQSWLFYRCFPEEQ
jgi:hypothetical protein